MDGQFSSRDRPGAPTPLRCPVCRARLAETLVRDLGGVTHDLFWQLHAGRCPEHGWFQTEVISRPPREIFAVSKPFGVARRMTVDGKAIYAFPTVFNDVPAAERRRPVDPLDERFWQVRRRDDAG